MRFLLVVCACLLAATDVLDAQRLGRAPRRPRLTAGADTNDASGYLQLGHRVMDENPTTAGEAYYWAARIDPSSADALYGLRMATLMRRATPFREYMEGNRRVVFSREMRANDSLQFRAYQLDPFLHLRHSRTAQFRYYRAVIERDMQLSGSVNAGEVDFAIQNMFNRASPGTLAWLAASEGRFDYALQLYGRAIEASRDPTYLYLDRAAIRARLGMHEDAISDYGIGLESLRKRDAKAEEEVVFYDSKALYEYSIGLLWTRKGDVEKAREAYGRAMEEDLSFYPAHLALARLALATGDTVTALSEAALAAEIAPNEPFVHLQYGDILRTVGRDAEAIVPLRRAIDLEPFYADPQYQLAVALERTGDMAGARAAYQRFLAIGARRDPRRAAVTAALAAPGGN